ncbi:unnamed protein product [Symbiodinium microadriaticum]|nr:unnamed protein product [Symbiodinium microadriaticum]
MELPYPICCSIGFFKKCCENSGCCTRVGKLGLKVFSDNRAKIMLFAASLSFLALILCIVSVCSLTYKDSQVKSTNWTYGESDTMEYFVNLYEVIVIVDNAPDVEIRWDDNDCNEGYCSDCKDACASSITTAIIALITCIPTLQTDLQRSTIKGDLNCQKFMGMFTGFVGTMSTLIALSSYADGCYRNLPDEDPRGSEIVWYLGPGFTCLLVATLLKPIDFLIHLLMPVEKPEEETDLSKQETK